MLHFVDLRVFLSKPFLLKLQKFCEVSESCDLGMVDTGCIWRDSGLGDFQSQVAPWAGQAGRELWTFASPHGSGLP